MFMALHDHCDPLLNFDFDNVQSESEAVKNLKNVVPHLKSIIEKMRMGEVVDEVRFTSLLSSIATARYMEDQDGNNLEGQNDPIEFMEALLGDWLSFSKEESIAKKVVPPSVPKFTRTFTSENIDPEAFTEGPVLRINPLNDNEEIDVDVTLKANSKGTVEKNNTNCEFENSLNTDSSPKTMILHIGRAKQDGSVNRSKVKIDHDNMVTISGQRYYIIGALIHTGEREDTANSGHWNYLDIRGENNTATLFNSDVKQTIGCEGIVNLLETEQFSI